MLNIRKYPEKAEQFEELRGIYGIRGVYGRTLTARNTCDTFICSHDDWLKAKLCKWNVTFDFRMINEKGVYFEDYVGINRPRKANVTHHFDYSRYNYQY